MTGYRSRGRFLGPLSGGLGTLDAIANKSSYATNILAGINGGYFWEINNGTVYFVFSFLVCNPLIDTLT
jgi:hypothetical protein